MGRQYDFEMLLVRHGDATSSSPTGDPGRTLTASGRGKIREICQAFERNEWFWSQAWVSPYVRAQQTFEELDEGLTEAFRRVHHDALPRPTVSPLLVPHGEVHEVARLLVTRGRTLFGPRPRQLVVAHNPLLSRLASLLITGEADGARSAHISLGRGDVVHLFIPAPSPFDLMLAPQNDEPLPRAVVLGMYPRALLAQVAPLRGEHEG